MKETENKSVNFQYQNITKMDYFLISTRHYVQFRKLGRVDEIRFCAALESIIEFIVIRDI